MPDSIRIHLAIRGIVQGVGFRPFVHRLAARYHLSGWVRNTVYGAELELEGTPQTLDAFVDALTAEQPPLAVMDEIRRTDGLPCQGSTGFQILQSEQQSAYDAWISPDVATCPDCLRELRSPTDRRYRYPFLNCTNCGPRFTIIRDIPYDRIHTSMSSFPMCTSCREEYDNILDRRYHAQPDCCPTCGPQLVFCNGQGIPQDGDPIGLAQDLLRAGGILAVKGLGGFHLACTLDDPATIQTLRQRKHRDEKPFALMCASVEAARQICVIRPEEEALLTSPSAPIVLLEKTERTPAFISENGWVGIMLPYTPLHHLLMEGFSSLVMTSANLSDCPVMTDNSEAFAHLHGIADGFLVHHRDIVNRCDDSLVRVFRGKKYFLRRSRGYAPAPISVSGSVQGILACGAEQKASFALGKGSQVFLSQHIGDLKNAETLTHYEEQIRNFQRLFGTQVRKLVCDLHPDYLSTQYALARAGQEQLPLLQVQHHHAHMVSCMADNGLSSPCIGVIWDGTGYGPDETTWGAEFLVGDAAGYRRLGSIRSILLPGGDLCTREIDRVAHSLLWDAGCAESSPLSPERAAFLSRQLNAGLNCPVASSMGRLFDGVYALISGRSAVTYEGQGAVLLEAMATQADAPYPCVYYEENGLFLWDTRPLIQSILEDLARKTDPAIMAAAFQDTLVELAVAQCRHLREQTGLQDVVLSGGVFQNMYLLPRILDRLASAGFRPYHHTRVSTNDEGISLGQIVIAETEV